MPAILILIHNFMKLFWYIQGPSWQTVYFDLGLTDSNIKVRLFSKVDLEF